MKNLTAFFLAFFFLAFFNSAQGQQGSQNPVGGLSYAPDSNYVIYSQFYKGRNGVALWVHKDSVNWLGGVKYDNHVFLSQNGNNFTGKLGRFDKPFADPWGAQDVLTEENLSFIGYQGDYSYSGVGAGNEFTRVDTFTLFDLSNSTYSMLNITGSNSSPFITDRTLPGSISTPKRIFINAPNSDFIYSDLLSLGLFAGVYNKNSILRFNARKVTATGGRVWGIQSGAAQSIVNIDSMEIDGEIAVSVYTDFTTTGNEGPMSRYHSYKIGNLLSGVTNTSDPYALFRVQKNGTVAYVDTLSYVNFDIGNVNANRAGLFWISSSNNQGFKNSTIKFKCDNYTTRVLASNYAFQYETLEDTVFNNSKVFMHLGTGATNNGLFRTGAAAYGGNLNFLRLAGNNRFVLDVTEFTTTLSTANAAAIELQNITLSDSAEIVINCDLCRFEGSSIPIRITNCVIPEGTKLIITGTYIYNRPGEIINIAGTNDLTGLQIKDAVFVNDGATEWITASTPTTIQNVSGVWTNSDSTVNVILQGNKLWAFQYPGNTNYYDLQTVLDSMYNAFVSGSDGNGIISALPSGNVSINAAGNNFDITSAGNITKTGSGSATYRFNLYPSSSLPVLLEQTSAGDTAYLQLRASLGRATLRATQDIYLEAANSIFVSTLEGSSTGIVSARPTGELIRREEAFFNAYFISDTITVAASETEINSTFLDAISPSFTISGDSIVYNGTDTAYFDIGYYTEAEVLESATGTYVLELSCYKNGVKVFPSESWHKVYFTASETEPIETIAKRFTTQLVTGDVLNIRQNGTTGISAALHNFSFTGQKLQ